MVALATQLRRAHDQRGFTLIELLVVILIIGILAAIAIPNLLSQQHKAYSAAAKQLVTSARTAAEAIATDHGGSYGEGSTAFVTLQAIHEYEPAIPTSQANANGGAWLYAAEPINNGAGYRVTAIAPKPNGEKFTIERNSAGEVLRKCEPNNPLYGCPANGSW